MSVQALSWALSVETGSGTRKAVLLGLANCHNAHSGLCCPKVQTLARELEFNESTVRRAIFALEDAGLLSVRETRRKDGSQGPNRYILNLGVQTLPLHVQTGTAPGGQTGTAPGQEPEEDLEPSEDSYESSADAGISVQKTEFDLLWDALEEHVQKAPIAKSARKAYAKLVREMFSAGWTPEMVVRRAKAYRRHPSLKDSAVSVAALAKWGEELDRGKRTLTEGGEGRDGTHQTGGSDAGVSGPNAPSVSVLPPEENARRMRELAERTVGALDGAGAFLSTPAPSSAHPSADPKGAPGEPVHPSAGSPNPS